MAPASPFLKPNKRRHPRLRLSSDVEAGVEVAGRQYVGPLLDVCCQGFGIALPAGIELARGTPALGEVWVAGRMFQGEGRVAHLRPAGGGLILGFGFSREDGLLGEALRACVEHEKQAGAVHLGARGDSLAASVIGLFSTRVAHDLFSLLRTGGLRRLDLAGCKALTTGGIGLLMLALDKGVRLCNCAADIRPLMETAHICRRCGTCPG